MSDQTDSLNADAGPVALGELFERCMGSGSLAAVLLEKLETQLRSDVAEIERLSASGSLNALCTTAHRLKGAAAATAVHSIRNLAADIEMQASAGRVATIVGLVEELRAETERFSRYLPTAAMRLRRGDVS